MIASELRATYSNQLMTPRATERTATEVAKTNQSSTQTVTPRLQIPPFANGRDNH